MLLYSLKCRKKCQKQAYLVCFDKYILNLLYISFIEMQGVRWSKIKIYQKTRSKWIIGSSLGLMTPVNKIPLLGEILFQRYKKNEIVNKLLLAGDMFMPEMHLRQPGFTQSACGTFTKNKERMQKLKETGNSRYIYQNKLDNTCFRHDMAYGDFEF